MAFVKNNTIDIKTLKYQVDSKYTEFSLGINLLLDLHHRVTAPMMLYWDATLSFLTNVHMEK